MKIPAHIAIIMDGNGRWAKARGLPVHLGHKAGCDALENMVEYCKNAGVKYLSVFAFSTENWRRSEEEVTALMHLFRLLIPRLKKKAMANDVQVRVMGDMRRFPKDLQRDFQALIDETAANGSIIFTVALGYGSRDELCRSVVALAKKVEAGTLAPEEITEEMISAGLDTGGIPDPDLVIRTSGEERLSNFMLWQSAYAELYFPDTLWPDFGEAELWQAIEVYNGRDRRFGGRKNEE